MARALIILFKDYHGGLDGGSLANRRNVELMQHTLGEDNVDCYFVNDSTSKRTVFSWLYAAVLFPFGFFNGLTPTKIREIVRISGEYDIVFISTSIFGRIARALRQHGYGGKIVSFFHNVEQFYYESRVPHRLPFRSWIIRCAARNDRDSLLYADITVGLCERDRQVLLNLYGKSLDVLVPITFKDKCENTKWDTEILTGKRPKCVFIGSNFPANANGVIWFVKEVMPHVDIDFSIVGQNMNLLKQQHTCLQDIPVYSDVPDLTPFWENADFMIFPVFEGSGMKVKTCEALMYGKNILGTDETFEGYDIDDRKAGARCNTATEYIETIRHYIEHPIPRFNNYNRELYLSHYSHHIAVREYKALFES